MKPQEVTHFHLFGGSGSGAAGFKDADPSIGAIKGKMVLLGGIQTLIGPVVGAVSYTWLQDVMARSTDYWHALLGAVILILVLLFPQGIAGFFGQLWQARRLPAGGVR